MRRLEYAGRGQIVDAVTKNLVSPQRVVFEYNLMSEAIANASSKPFAMPQFAYAPQTSHKSRARRK